ncbi:MAG: phage protein Gp36 family protein [Planktothrix rubescens PR223]|jgi:hypothetical protein
MFILPFDFEMTIRAEILAIVNKGNQRAQRDAEATAIEEIRGYIQDRYDCDQIFVDVFEFSNSATYNQGDIIFYDNGTGPAVYVCTTSSTGNTPDNTAYFEQRDPRSRLIVMYACDIVLYHLFSSVAPQKLSELRVKRYDDAIDWLKRVNTGKLSPVLPVFTNQEDSADNIPWGSNEKMGHNY